MTPDPTSLATSAATHLAMPAIARAASTRSRQAQLAFKRSILAGLALLIVAAIAGSLGLRAGKFDAAGLAVLLAFLSAGSLRAYRLARRPDRVWYASRALAEEIKSLVWRYSVGGKPYGLDARLHGDPESRLIKRLNALVDRPREESLSLPAPEEGAEHITASMRALRLHPLDERRAAYAAGRIADQQRYYTKKTQALKQRADQWNMALLGAEAVGVLAALIRLLHPFAYDLFGLAGTIVAAGTSWMQLNQYTSLAERYSAMAHKLGGHHGRAITPDLPWTEVEWARFVEDLLAEEHSQWRDMHDPDGYSSGALA